MHEYEILVYASYKVNERKEYNCFKEYRKGRNVTEVRKMLKAELKADGYSNIEMEVR